MFCKYLKTGLYIGLLPIAIGTACAQYVWIDSNGTRQYSDNPPPASIPKKQIMKDPGFELRSSSTVGATSSSTTAAVVADAGATGATPPASAIKQPMTIKEKNVDFGKRQTEQAEKDRKIADEAKEAAAKAKNCERVQAYARSLQSGERIASTDQNGEKTFLSDEKRSQETSDAMRALNGCK